MRLIGAYIRLASLYRRGSVRDAASSIRQAAKSSMVRRFVSNTWFKIAFVLAKMAANGQSQPALLKRVMMYRLVAVGQMKVGRSMNKLRLQSGSCRIEDLKTEVYRQLCARLIKRNENKARLFFKIIRGQARGKTVEMCSPIKIEATRQTRIFKHLIKGIQLKMLHSLKRLKDFRIVSPVAKSSYVFESVTVSAAVRDTGIGADIFDKLRQAKRRSLETIQLLQDSQRREELNKVIQDYSSKQRRLESRQAVQYLVGRLNQRLMYCFQRLQLNRTQADVMSSETYFKVKTLLYRMQVACLCKQLAAWTALKDQWLSETDRSHLLFVSSRLLSAVVSKLSRASRDKCQWSMSRLQQNALLYRPVVDGQSSARQSFKLSRMEAFEVVRQQSSDSRLTLCQTECLVMLPLIRPLISQSIASVTVAG